MSYQYNFEKGKIPASYEAVDWQMRLERVPTDYGQPNEYQTPLGFVFEDVERNREYMLEAHPYW